MDNSQGDVVANPRVSSIDLDLTNLDLNTLAALKGTALQSIIEDLDEDCGEEGRAKHSSHHSHNQHATAMW